MKKTFELVSDTKHLAPFREDLRTELRQAQVPEKVIGEIVLAVDEGLTNIMRHAYDGARDKRIEVTLDLLDDRIELTLCDSGKRFDPTRRPDPELPPTKPGGLGIHLIKSLMNKVRYDEAYTRGNRLILTRYIDWKEQHHHKS